MKIANNPQMSLLDQVLMMKQQGLSDNQIIQTLQRAGNGPQQIFDAMSQAEIKGGIEGVPVSELGENAYPENQMQMQPQQQQPYPPQYAQYPAPQGGITNEEVEAIAESIIDEKWDELMKSMSKVIAWKEEMDNKFAEMEQKFDDLQKDFDELHKSVLGRVSDYDKTMTNVSTDLKAMSTVFQKVLPGFIETVGELSQIRDDLKPSVKLPSAPVYREKQEEDEDEPDEQEEAPAPVKKKSIEQRF